MGFVTTGPCAVKQSGVVVSLDFGSDVLLWTNPTATTSITAAIPNGFYANHNVLFSEPNMIPINIKSGVSIFGVSGTLSNDSCVAALALAGATSATGVSATNATINWVAVGASSLALTGLSSNTTYKFRVKAISSQGLTDCNTVDLSVTTASQTIPTDLTNLSIWLKAEDLSGNTDGTPVSTWVDSSTNSRDFTGAGAVRPIYRANALNSLGALEFDGLDDEMSFGSNYAVNDFTLFYVATATGVHEIDAEATSGTSGVGGQRYLAYPVQSGTDGGAGVSFGTNGISVYEHGNGYLPPLAVTGGAFPTATIIVISYSGKQRTIYNANALLRTGQTSTMPTVHAPRYLGSTNFTSFSGRVHEFISFSRTLTNQERTDMVNYLKNKFGI